MVKNGLPAVLLLLLMTMNCLAQTCMLQPVPLEQRVATAGAIIEGKVVKQLSYRNQAHTQILTANFIEVYKVFKGAAVPDTVAFVVQGGQVGTDKLVVRPGIELQTGDYGVFTLAPLSQDYLADVVQASHPNVHFYRDNAWSQSFVAVSGNLVHDIFYPLEGENGRQQLYSRIFAILNTSDYLEKKAYDPAIFKGLVSSVQRSSAIVSFSPASVAAGTLSNRSILTITGSGFGATQGTGEVLFRNANNGGVLNGNPSYISASSNIVNQFISWTDTEIVLRVPSGAGTGDFIVRTDNNGANFNSGTPLTVEFNATSIVSGAAGSGNYRYEPDLVSDNGAGGYTLTYNSTFYANTAALAAFQDALKNWVHRTGVNFTAGAATSSTSTNNSADGENIVSFSGSLPGGNLGVSFSSYSGCGFPGDPLSWEWYLYDVDLLFNSATPWYYGCDATAIPSTSYDFESVAVHELGHHHQLGHIIDPSGVMHFDIGNSHVKRTIQANDKEGGDYVLSHSTQPNSCASGPMTLISGPAPDCAPVPLPVDLVSFDARPTRQHHVNLTWVTATEEHNSHFTVERSATGQDFFPLFRVAGKGTSTELQTYTITDNQPLSGKSYYRLKQTDFDGQFSYSKIAAVNINQQPETGISIFPNPAGSMFFIKLPGPASQPVAVTVFDALGRPVYQVQQKVQPENDLIPVNPEHKLPAGIYLIKVTAGTQVFTQKLILNGS